MSHYISIAEAEERAGPVFVAPEELAVDRELSLRRTSFETLDDGYRLLDANRDYLTPYLGNLTGYTYEEAVDDCFDAMEQMAEGRSADYGIFVAGRMVGSIDMHFPTSDLGVLSVWVSRSSQGLGIATRASQGLIRYAFQETRVHRVQMDIRPDNTASKKVATRLGAHKIADAADGLPETWEVRKDAPQAEVNA